MPEAHVGDPHSPWLALPLWGPPRPVSWGSGSFRGDTMGTGRCDGRGGTWAEWSPVQCMHRDVCACVLPRPTHLGAAQGRMAPPEGTSDIANRALEDLSRGTSCLPVAAGSLRPPLPD